MNNYFDNNKFKFVKTKKFRINTVSKSLEWWDSMIKGEHNNGWEILTFYQEFDEDGENILIMEFSKNIIETDEEFQNRTGRSYIYHQPLLWGNLDND